MIGAWNHGGVKQSSPYLEENAPVSPAPGVLRQEVLRFLDAYLKGSEPRPGIGKRGVYLYPGIRKLAKIFPVAPGRWLETALVFWSSAPFIAGLPTEAGSDRYEVNFEHTSGVFNRWWELGVVQGKRVDTTGREAQRDRVLTYESDPLESDLEIAGWPVVTLRVASSEPDCAFYVYLEDVLPDGRIVALTDGQLALDPPAGER